ncbi:Baeyer-Villiger monooxygenase [Folsomia candida]|uniref:Flavin-containing monooxygenase n=1 Tax=Folsomia candida TaxID=158441 RepID=A0A226F664_FOLCA|nr:Baeyer-Villiger monooxygenase [Folsomia candida]
MGPKICIIGAGFSGMAAAIQIRKQLGLTDFVMFDENEDVGGTWLVNKYPGCACDVASHLYSFSFEPNTDWSQQYSSQPEILRYLQKVAKKHDLYRNIKFNHKVNKLTWEENISKWRVVVYNKRSKMESEVIFDVIISGIGSLRIPNIPDEFATFKGTRMHSAEWDTSVKLEGKSVAIVGSGASAVQIIPSIAKKVERLVVYQRHPAWVVPRMQFKIPEFLKWSFESLPGVRGLYRSYIFLNHEFVYPAFKQGSLFQKIGKILSEFFVNHQLGHNPELMEKVKPNYEFGCKRITPSNIYYPALALPHVEVVRREITKVKENSIVTEDGKEEKVDVLILATGFNVQDFFFPLEIKVKNGVDLMQLWKKEGPAAYKGICCSAAPNLFHLLGPNSSLGHNSVVFLLECQVDYVVQIIRELMEREASVVCVKESVEGNYMAQLLKAMEGTVWASGCGSWYNKF